jgi:hypothetical protein
MPHRENSSRPSGSLWDRGAMGSAAVQHCPGLSSLSALRRSRFPAFRQNTVFGAAWFEKSSHIAPYRETPPEEAGEPSGGWRVGEPRFLIFPSSSPPSAVWCGTAGPHRGGFIRQSHSRYPCPPFPLSAPPPFIIHNSSFNLPAAPHPCPSVCIRRGGGGDEWGLAGGRASSSLPSTFSQTHVGIF